MYGSSFIRATESYIAPDFLSSVRISVVAHASIALRGINSFSNASSNPYANSTRLSFPFPDRSTALSRRRATAAESPRAPAEAAESARICLIGANAFLTRAWTSGGWRAVEEELVLDATETELLL